MWIGFVLNDLTQVTPPHPFNDSKLLTFASTAVGLGGWFGCNSEEREMLQSHSIL